MTQGYGLQDKVVIVTGGAAGIGRATAMRFAEEGARISIWDMNAETGAATLADLKQMNVEAMFQLVNVADADAVEKAVADIVSAWGHVDVLVNNAGITRDVDVHRHTGRSYRVSLANKTSTQVDRTAAVWLDDTTPFDQPATVAFCTQPHCLVRQQLIDREAVVDFCAVDV